MDNNLREVFTEDGKELAELLQEWMNENKAHIVANIDKETYNTAQ